MARAPQRNYEDDTNYSVKLLRPVHYAGTWLYPHQTHFFTGRAIREMEANEANEGALAVGDKAEVMAPNVEFQDPKQKAKAKAAEDKAKREEDR